MHGTTWNVNATFLFGFYAHYMCNLRRLATICNATDDRLTVRMIEICRTCNCVVGWRQNSNEVQFLRVLYAVQLRLRTCHSRREIGVTRFSCKCPPIFQVHRRALGTTHEVMLCVGHRWGQLAGLMFMVVCRKWPETDGQREKSHERIELMSTGRRLFITFTTNWT